MAATTKPFAEARELVARATEVVDGGQQALIASVQAAARIEAEFLGRIMATLEARDAAFDQDAKSVVNEVQLYRADIREVLAAQGELRTALVGDGSVRDLIGVLQRVDETLSRIGLNA